MKTPSESTWSLQDLSSDNSGRDLTGTMHKDTVAQKRKITCKWSTLTWGECQTLAQMMKKDKQTVVSLYYPDIMTGDYITKSFYTGDMNVDYYNWSGTEKICRNISCDFIEV